MLVAELKIVTSFLMEAPAEMLPILDEAAKVSFLFFKKKYFYCYTAMTLNRFI